METAKAKNEIPKKGTRKGDGGIYLVVADKSEEFDIALRYAVHMAKSHRGYVGIAHVTEMDDFQHWGSVELHMKGEIREDAEKYVWEVAKKVGELGGDMPCIYICEGKVNDVIVNLIKDDPSIIKLVLPGSASGSQNPLVSYFTGKGLDLIDIPLVIVPGHVEFQRIERMH